MDGMNKYIAFYNGKEVVVKATSSYSAQKKAQDIFKAKKSWMISVVLIETSDGKEVTHSTSTI